MRKFKLTEDTRREFPSMVKLYRIQATKDFGNVRKGDLGGWVESEDNLSQDGNAWIAGFVYGNGYGACVLRLGIAAFLPALILWHSSIL